jgi:hypothetical protein
MKPNTVATKETVEKKKKLVIVIVVVVCIYIICD